MNLLSPFENFLNTTNSTSMLSLFFIILTYLLIIIGIIFVLSIIIKIIRTKKQKIWVNDQKYHLLLISVPKDNEKSPLAAEQMFAALHGIYKTAKELNAEGAIQDHLSFEIVSIDKYIRFYVYVPAGIKEFVKGQIYAQYPSVDIEEVEDYTQEIKDKGLISASTELGTTKSDCYPIKTFPNFEVDPLAGITGALTEVGPGDQIWIQILTRPVSDEWQAKGITLVDNIRTGKADTISPFKQVGKSFLKLIGELALTAAQPQTAADHRKAQITAEEKPQLPAPVEAGLKGIEEKITKLGFETKIRIFVWANDVTSARSKLHTTIGAFKQFNTTNLSGFVSGPVKISDEKLLNSYRARMFPESTYIFNIEELASVFHLPSVSVETPNIVWAGSKKGEPPANLPIAGTVPEDELVIFAKTDFRNSATDFGLKLDDRRRHLYTIGKTGVGKTTMLETMVISDIRDGKGVAVVDPHGDFVERILNFIPAERVKDVVLFDPSDINHPVGFNLLENVSPDLKNIVTSGLVGIFQKIWAYTWGPRLEHILRNAVMALLDYPDSTILGILKMLNDKNFRHKVMDQIKDPVIRDFWVEEFENYNDRLRSEAVAPIQNKVGQFVSSQTIRNIIGQPKSTIDMKDIMDNKKILLINLSKGKIGEDNSALLGAMLITKIQLTAMARASIPEEDRVDFYLYVDEFQNFATESFATIFSEARKYKLNIAVANQYIAQMPEEVREAVFGNVGTIISFRVGASDAPFLAKEYSPVFEESDLVNLDKYHIYIKMSIEGVTCPAFSAITIALPDEPEGFKEQAMAASRTKYGSDRAKVEELIAEWSATASKPSPRTDSESHNNFQNPANPNAISFSSSDRGSSSENQLSKLKGPSAIIRVGSQKYAEYTDQKNDHWYQKMANSESGESEENNQKTENNTPASNPQTQSENKLTPQIIDLNQNIDESKHNLKDEDLKNNHHSKVDNLIELKEGEIIDLN